MSDLSGFYFDALLRSNVDLININNKDRVKNRECGELELDALECLEAYGTRRGRKYCGEFIGDFQECISQYIQKQRINVMRRERIKQVLRGERKPSELLDSIKPPRDSFQTGPFYN